MLPDGSFLESVKMWIAMLFWHFVFLWQFLLYAILIFLHVWILPNFVVPTLIALYVAYVAFDKRRMTGTAKRGWFSKSWFLQYALRWFPIELVRTTVLDPNKIYIFGIHPHSVIPWTAIVTFPPFWSRLFHGIHVRLLAASVVFFIPIVREAFLLAGTTSDVR
jgi:2-acylglycerol O-acyltransferase 2